jgi:biopolymer transport protein TolR
MSVSVRSGRGRRRRQPMAEINVVPYIDVMLVLLVIFMITAPLLTQGVQVDLPQTTSQPMSRQQEEPLIVSIDREGLFYINIGDDADQPVDRATLMARTAAVLRRRPQTQVVVKGDDKVDYGRVVEAMSLLQQSGAPSVGLLTRPPGVAE